MQEKKHLTKSLFHEKDYQEARNRRELPQPNKGHLRKTDSLTPYW